jgi:hypothetical protein
VTRFAFVSSHARHVAIVGSRHLNDYRKFCTAIRPLLRSGDVIVSGRSPGGGIDILAAKFARQNGHQLIEYPIDQSLIDQKVAEGLDSRAAFAFAAMARNTQIVQRSDIMIAIPCDHSRGTMDSIRKFRVKIADEDTGRRGGGGQVIRLFNFLWDCGRAS